MNVALGADHAGVELRDALARKLAADGHTASIHGATDGTAYDYPLAARSVACEVAQGRADAGVLVCGTGIGMSIAANRNPAVRAAVCWDTVSARLAREHNGANILCLGARMLDTENALAILDVFLHTSEDASDRHVRRRRQMEETASCE
jgi:ribose 5-phosphate isomerase B